MGDTVKNIIKDCRMNRGMTQQELGDRAGVSRQSINSIEKEKYIPSLPLALKLSKIFNCTVNELFKLGDDNG